jgi:ribosomal protein S18 acetylase RimI-like enzyme
MGIRATRPTDLPELRAIEWAAGQRFLEFGLAHIADDGPLATEVLATYVDEGRSWVATQPDDRPIGYVLVDELDGLAHIEQVSVLPEHQGSGHGRALVERVAVTLTTYDHIPWNRPLYEHLGFQVLDLAKPGSRAGRPTGGRGRTWHGRGAARGHATRPRGVTWGLSRPIRRVVPRTRLGPWMRTDEPLSSSSV